MENNFNSSEFKNRKELINQFYNFLEEDRNRLKTIVENDKNWIEKQPSVQEFLNKLQYFLQEKNIVFFSKLITTLVNDILGNIVNSDEENESIRSIIKEISFDLTVKSGVPALKIGVKNEDDNSEEITSGGLKNVIATGLRVLALWRLTSNVENSKNKGEFNHRKFIVLDEPDCWISESSIPNYAKFLSQLSDYFNLQIVMVTHKNVDYFKNYGRVYKITNSGFVKVSLLSDIKNDDDSTTSNDCIKKIHIKNFKAHKDTEIELDPRLTVIVGKSNSGKSVIMEAFDAIVNNSSSDACIRHYENRASVSIYLKDNDENKVVTWERVRKTNQEFPQKVKYTLNSENNNGDLVLLNDEFNSYNTPEFAENVLKMKKINNIDVHLGKQEGMNFLLSSEITDNERAKILSLGKESSYIHKMMDNLKTKTRDIKSNIKNNELRYNKVLSSLCNLSTIDSDDGIYIRLVGLEKSINKYNLMINDLNNIYSDIYYSNKVSSIKFKHTKKQFKIFNNINKLDEKIKELDVAYKISSVNVISKNNKKFEIIDISKIDDLLKISTFEKIKNIKFKNKDVKFATLYNLNDIDSTITKYKNIKLIMDLNLSNNYKNKKTFNIADINKIDSYGKKIKLLINNIKSEKNELLEINKKINENKIKLANIEKELDFCPACGSKLNVNNN